ncbi:hypothetical protein [Roseimarinus sediminis]|jgi:hypothetical protein|uniref:hypothetical protein n=1 Tax=Roseimarinus sediminis TaxID=1610899 RepID=UPI003D19BF7B
MNDRSMGRRCKFASQCHIYQGLVQLKQPLFLVKNIYCNNGPRWWQKCAVYDKFSRGEEISESMIPAEDLRQD